jgi:trehalose 6-phosphate phosphatase
MFALRFRREEPEMHAWSLRAHGRDTSAVSPELGTGAGAAELGRLRANPTRSAVLSDVDGTLAPISERPEQAAVPAQAILTLRRLSERYGLVGCISGRPAVEARRMVRVKGLSYAGNHGLELLRAGDETPELDTDLMEKREEAARFVAELEAGDLARAELRLEDKGPIQALHWRGAGDEGAAESRAREIAAAAEREGLAVHWGRKVLELRPAVPIGKDAAIDALLAGGGIDAAVYAGDDRTDLDAFRRLRELHEAGALETAICVGVVSEEGPAEIASESDLRVDGPEGWLAMLEALAE